jgi:phage protein D
MPILERSAPLLLIKMKIPGGDVRVVSDHILGFNFKDRERKADLLTLTVKNNNLENFDDPIWRKGTELIVSWGYPGGMHPERECIVTGVKGFRTLQIEAQAKSVLMNRTVKSRTFSNVKASEVASQIASEIGFGSDQIFVDDTEHVIDTITQAKLTDAQFLKRWAAKVGFEFYVDFEGFHFHERRLDSAPIRVLRYFTDQAGGDIIDEPTIENDITGRPGRVVVKGRDPYKKQDINEVADNDSDNNRNVIAPVTELLLDDTTTEITVRKRFPEKRIGGNDTVLTADDNASKASQTAKSRFRRAQQVAVKMKLTIVGDPLLLAKSVVQIEGMGQRLSIRYWVEEVEHVFTPGSYTCQLSLVSDGHGGHKTDSNLTQTDLNQVQGKAGVGAGKTKGINETILKFIQDGSLAALELGDTLSQTAFQNSLVAYNSKGNKAKVQITTYLQPVLAGFRNESVSIIVANFAAKVISALAQDGEETSSGGNLNNKDSNIDDSVLEEVTFIDDETGAVRTVYKQSKPRGAKK